MIMGLVAMKNTKDFGEYSKAFDKVKDNIKYVENARPGHDFRYSINHSKITKELGWKPKVSMVEAVMKTVDWYLKNQDWVKNIKSGEYQEINDKYRY
jgi:dTDP-glucose 4,6-dehydratase